MSQSKMPQPVRLGVCTSAAQYNIEALLKKLKLVPVIASVKFIQLPYNDLDSYRLDVSSIDALILCHSIHNRRFAITNVMDALYDKFLPKAMRLLGRNNVAVIVHDIDWPMKPNHEALKAAQLESFERQQPLTFQCASLAMICGKLESTVEMDDQDWSRVEAFLANMRPLMSLKTYVDDLKSAVLAAIFAIGGITWARSSRSYNTAPRFLLLKSDNRVPVPTVPEKKTVWHYFSHLCFRYRYRLAVLGFLAVPVLSYLLSSDDEKDESSQEEGQLVHSNHGASTHWKSAPWWQMHFRFWWHVTCFTFRYLYGVLGFDSKP